MAKITTTRSVSAGLRKRKATGNKAKREAMKIVEAVAYRKLDLEKSLKTHPKKKSVPSATIAVKKTTGSKPGAMDKKMEILKPIRKTVKSTKKRIAFEVQAPSVQNVLLVGDFNQWDQKGIQMKRQKGNEKWKTFISLEPGTYQYKFLIDDQWVVDENNPHRITNEFGTENAVIQV